MEWMTNETPLNDLGCNMKIAELAKTSENKIMIQLHEAIIVHGQE